MIKLKIRVKDPNSGEYVDRFPLELKNPEDSKELKQFKDELYEWMHECMHCGAAFSLRETSDVKSARLAGLFSSDEEEEPAAKKPKKVSKRKTKA